MNMFEFQSTIHVGDDLCDLELSLDSSTASSEISLSNDDDDWCGSRYNYLRNVFGVYREHSYMIHFYERNRHAGDSIWFRVWRNDEGNKFVELEDAEVLQFVQKEIQLNPACCFYVKMTQRGGFTSTTLFDADLIGRALSTILERAQRLDHLVVPSKAAVEQAILREKRGQRGMLVWFPLVGTGRSAGSR